MLIFKNFYMKLREILSRIPSRSKTDITVLLDAGHGGIVNGVYITPGKRSPVWPNGTQYYEGVGNREIRDKVAIWLELWGIPFKYVSEGNNDVSLKDRVKTINDICSEKGSKKVLLLSIHSDAFANPTAHGWSAYTSKGDTGVSDRFATECYLRMQDQFPDARFRVDMSDGDPDKESQFYILRKTWCPAVLVENFFMTNPNECQEILLTAEGQNKIAHGLALAIAKIVN